MSRVLVVDDEPPIRAILGRLLKRRGFDFRDAGTLAEATAWLRTWSPKVVILDPGLGPEDGLELLPRYARPRRSSCAAARCSSTRPPARPRSSTSPSTSVGCSTSWPSSAASRGSRSGGASAPTSSRPRGPDRVLGPLCCSERSPSLFGDPVARWALAAGRRPGRSAPVDGRGDHREELGLGEGAVRGGRLQDVDVAAVLELLEDAALLGGDGLGRRGGGHARETVAAVVD